MDDTDPAVDGGWTGRLGWGWWELRRTDKKTGKVYNVLLLIMTGGCRLVSQCNKNS